MRTCNVAVVLVDTVDRLHGLQSSSNDSVDEE